MGVRRPVRKPCSERWGWVRVVAEEEMRMVRSQMCSEPPGCADGFDVG